MKLEAVKIAATSARMEWRHLDEQEEKPHVDGVQVEILDLKPILIKQNFLPPASSDPTGHVSGETVHPCFDFWTHFACSDGLY